MTPPEEIKEKETAAAEEAVPEAPGKPETEMPAEEKPEEETAAPEKAEKPKAKEKTKVEKVKKIRKKRRRMLERTAENDIRYRGPFSYRHFRIFAWFFIILAQIALLMRLGLKLDPASAPDFDPFISVLSPIGALALPFFLIANFATILDGREEYSRQLLRFGLISAAVIIGYELVYHRYFLGGMSVLIRSEEEAEQYILLLTGKFFPLGFASFNIFIDLFLCSLFMYLLNGRPKKLFQGKKIIFFRLLAVLPILYEMACIAVKFLAGSKLIQPLPVWSYPFLTTKPPMTFLLFIVLAFYVKKRERIFRKHGRTHEDFQAYMQTNYNSLRFSLFTAGLVSIAAIIDLLAVFLLPGIAVLIQRNLINRAMDLATGVVAAGVGGSIILFPMIPFILLFSYTKAHKNRLFDVLLPLIGIGAIFLVYVEGSFQVLKMYGAVMPEALGDVFKGLIALLTS